MHGNELSLFIGQGIIHTLNIYVARTPVIAAEGPFLVMTRCQLEITSPTTSGGATCWATIARLIIRCKIQEIINPLPAGSIILESLATLIPVNILSPVIITIFKAASFSSLKQMQIIKIVFNSGIIREKTMDDKSKIHPQWWETKFLLLLAF